MPAKAGVHYPRALLCQAADEVDGLKEPDRVPEVCQTTCVTFGEVHEHEIGSWRDPGWSDTSVAGGDVQHVGAV
jgi:hypothetical protein